MQSRLELAHQFGSMSIPALAVMKNGHIVHQAVGTRPRSAIESKIYDAPILPDLGEWALLDYLLKRNHDHRLNRWS